MKATLELILDVRCHPVLVVDAWVKCRIADHSLGIHQTGIVFGCLRVMQGWNFASALSEVGSCRARSRQYRTHSGPNRHRYADETYIELFDPDIVNLPPVQCLPSWWDDGPIEEDEWVEVDIKEKSKDKKDKKKEKHQEKEREKDERRVEKGEEEARLSLAIESAHV